MCHADISVQTFQWRPDYGAPWPNFNVRHECRNWEALLEWNDKRLVNTTNKLWHPILGISHPLNLLFWLMGSLIPSLKGTQTSGKEMFHHPRMVAMRFNNDVASVALAVFLDARISAPYMVIACNQWS